MMHSPWVQYRNFTKIIFTADFKWIIFIVNWDSFFVNLICILGRKQSHFTKTSAFYPDLCDDSSRSRRCSALTLISLIFFSCVVQTFWDVHFSHFNIFLTHDLLIFVHLALFNTQTICIIFQLICDLSILSNHLTSTSNYNFYYLSICQNGGGSGSDSTN